MIARCAAILAGLGESQEACYLTEAASEIQMLSSMPGLFRRSALPRKSTR